MKKLVVIVLIIILAAGGYFGYTKFLKKEKPEEEKRKVITKQRPAVNIIDIEKRPYVTLVPREDGNEVGLSIIDLKGREKLVEYELEYQAGSLLQGAGGRIDLAEEPLPVTKNLLFGSCSKGKCKYDEDVSGGSLALYFENGEDYGVKGDFTIKQMSEAEGVFRSRDVKAELDVGEDGLGNSVFIIVASTIGLPEKVDGDVIEGPVGFFTAGIEKIDDATLTFKTSKDIDSPLILAWDGSEWIEYEAEKEDGGYLTTVDMLATFVLVKE
jgi:hypothetical protein